MKRKFNNPVLWKIESMKIPEYSIEETFTFPEDILKGNNIYEKKLTTDKGIPFDINRISSRNANKGELGPYKNSFLREIISSHKMGKATGVKSDLVSTILSFYEKNKT